MTSDMSTALVLYDGSSHISRIKHNTVVASLSAAQQVFGIAELIEAILLHMNADSLPTSSRPEQRCQETAWPPDVKALFSAIRSNKTIQRVIAGSQKLRKMMFLQYRITPPPVNRYLADERGELYPSWWISSDVYRKYTHGNIMSTVQPNPLLLAGSLQLPILRIFRDGWWYTNNDSKFLGIRLNISASKEVLERWTNMESMPSGASWEKSLAMNQAVGLQRELRYSHGQDVHDVDRLEFEYYEATMENVVRELRKAIIISDMNDDLRTRAWWRRYGGEEVTCECELCRDPTRLDMASVWW
ncbi:hypothetical protein LTR95_011573 [Oleoguttula sp. CCFEE 5521]